MKITHSAKATGITLSENTDGPAAAFGLQVETESNGSIYVVHMYLLHWLKKT